jgi:hypothetical protein
VSGFAISSPWDDTPVEIAVRKLRRQADALRAEARQARAGGDYDEAVRLRFDAIAHDRIAELRLLGDETTTLDAARKSVRSERLNALADKPALGGVRAPGAQVLDDVAEWLRCHVSVPDDHYVTVLVLWAAHTYLVHSFDSTPRLAVLSPEKQCGKTRVLELLDLVCAGAERLSDASPAYVFRRIADGPVTILLDEADAIWRRGKADESAEALRSIVNAGHRKGAFVGRVAMNGKAAQLERHHVYAPVALAGIGAQALPDTILDRAVVLHMKRIAPSEHVAEYRERTTAPEGHELRDRLTGWAESVADRIGNEWPAMPPGVRDRAADVWEPLVVVADLAGGSWPTRARDACMALVGAASEDAASVGVRLLTDLYTVFDERDGVASARWTDTILGALHAMDEAPWGDWYGRKFSARDLAKVLRNYGAKSRDVRIGDAVAKGYRSQDLWDAWTRYGVLGTGSATCATSATGVARVVADVAHVAHTPPNDQELVDFDEPRDADR